MTPVTAVHVLFATLTILLGYPFLVPTKANLVTALVYQIPGEKYALHFNEAGCLISIIDTTSSVNGRDVLVSPINHTACTVPGATLKTLAENATLVQAISISEQAITKINIEFANYQVLVSTTVVLKNRTDLEGSMDLSRSPMSVSTVLGTPLSGFNYIYFLDGKKVKDLGNSSTTAVLSVGVICASNWQFFLSRRWPCERKRLQCISTARTANATGVDLFFPESESSNNTFAFNIQFGRLI